MARPVVLRWPNLLARNYLDGPPELCNSTVPVRVRTEKVDSVQPTKAIPLDSGLVLLCPCSNLYPRGRPSLGGQCRRRAAYPRVKKYNPTLQYGP